MITIKSLSIELGKPHTTLWGIIKRLKIKPEYIGGNRKTHRGSVAILEDNQADVIRKVLWEAK